jgi:hypothetical protein
MPPVSLVLTCPATTQENKAITLSGRFYDPGYLDPHTVTVNWGDGESDAFTIHDGVLSFDLPHTYKTQFPTSDMICGQDERWYDTASFCQKLRVNNDTIINGCLGVRKNVVSSAGHFASAQTNDYRGLVGEANVAGINAALDSLATWCSTDLPAYGLTELMTLQERQVDYCCCEPEFSFRNVSQYRTQDWKLFETRWASLARQAGIGVSTWTEDPVHDTYPYPGREVWKDRPTYRRLDLKLWTPATGHAVDRAGPYENPTFNVPAEVIPDGSYMVIT